MSVSIYFNDLLIYNLLKLIANVNFVLTNNYKFLPRIRVNKQNNKKKLFRSMSKTSFIVQDSNVTQYYMFLNIDFALQRKKQRKKISSNVKRKNVD